jgi:hypothetical protein
MATSSPPSGKVSTKPGQLHTINDTAGAATAQALGAPVTPVVHVLAGGGRCSGVLIDPTHVITAQHCTFGVSAGVMSVQFFDATNSLFATRTVAAKFEIDATNSLLDGTDVAILTLSSAAPASVTPLTFFDGNPTAIGIDTVGFGLNGLGSTGHGGTWDGLRWGAENVVDFYGQAAGTSAFISGTANIFSTDFDDGTAANNTLGWLGSSAIPLLNEGTTAPGDSGGPLLAMIDGAPRILGVLSGGTTATSQYGDISWWTGTSQWRTFIETNATNAVFYIPEPGTLALLGAGLLCVGVVAQRRRKKRA